MISISVAGTALLLLALVAATMGSIVGFAMGVTRQRWLSDVLLGLALSFAVLVLAACGLMEIALLRHDFTVSYVAEVGSKDTPLFFTIASLWASLNGSILLWCGVLGVYVIGISALHGPKHREYMPFAYGVLLAICVFFTGLVSSVANPFAATSPDRLLEMCAQFQCVDGMPLNGPGPNPLLQNHWLMVLHPPVLYAGYVGMSVPFAMCAAALFAGRLDAGWVAPVRAWFLVPWGLLTVGIFLGGWWSYAVLGWGGWWAWDPVENASFMPWLVGTAFLHSAMVLQRRAGLKTWTLLLGMSCFILTMYGTFLTRSGVFNSVHAFAEGPVGPAFLALIVASLVFTVVLLAAREHLLHTEVLPALRTALKARGGNQLGAVFGVVLLIPVVFAVTLLVARWGAGLYAGGSEGLGALLLVAAVVWWIPFAVGAAFLAYGVPGSLSREFAILLQNIAFTVFCFVVFAGTTYPLAVDALRSRKVSVGEPFFDAFALPLGTAIVWLMGVGPMFPWGRATTESAWRRFLPPFAIGALLALIVGVFPTAHTDPLLHDLVSLPDWLASRILFQRPLVCLAVLASVFAVCVSGEEALVPVVQRIRTQGENPLVAMWRVFSRAHRRWGGHIAHFGLAMAVFAMAFAKGFQQEKDVELTRGVPAEFGGYEVVYKGVETRQEAQRHVEEAVFGVQPTDVFDRLNQALFRQPIGELRPALNKYPTRMDPLPAPAIRTRPYGDLYLVLLKSNDADHVWVRMKSIPLAMWIWFAPAIILLGAAIALVPTRVRRPAAATAPSDAAEGARA